MADPGLSIRHTFQSAAAATGNGTVMEVAALAIVGAQITGTFVATVTWEGSVDGTNYVAILAHNLGTGAKATTATAAGTFQIPVSGLTHFRARVSAYTSGNVTVVGNGVYGGAVPALAP